MLCHTSNMNVLPHCKTFKVSSSKHDAQRCVLTSPRYSVADVGEGPGGPAPPPPPLFWIKKEEMTKGKMADGRI